MADRLQYPESDPRHHTIKLKDTLRGIADHAREDISKIDDPKAEALFETISEVVGGLVTALEHYETRAEAAWR